MVIGALVTMAFFFAYTQVRTADQNVSFQSAQRIRWRVGGREVMGRDLRMIC
jgi:hypothetical protein